MLVRVIRTLRARRASGRHVSIDDPRRSTRRRAARGGRRGALKLHRSANSPPAACSPCSRPSRRTAVARHHRGSHAAHADDDSIRARYAGGRGRRLRRARRRPRCCTLTTPNRRARIFQCATISIGREPLRLPHAAGKARRGVLGARGGAAQAALTPRARVRAPRAVPVLAAPTRSRSGVRADFGRDRRPRAAVRMPFAEAAIDVDRASDLALATRILAQRKARSEQG